MASIATDRCRYCGTALDALTRRRGIANCDSSQCRHRAAQAHTTRIKAALSAAAPAAACAQLPHLPKPSAIVWLKHHEPRIVELSDEERAQHRAYLESVIAEHKIIDRGRLAPSTADDSHAQGARLCGQCRGRCCEHGADWRAFIDVTVLERWQQEEEGRTPADAIDAYMAMLPRAHVARGCLYQTETGCAMPRERRAEICNGFACDALEEVQRAASRDPGAVVVAVTFHKNEVDRAAVIDASSTHPLKLAAPR